MEPATSDRLISLLEEILQELRTPKPAPSPGYNCMSCGQFVVWGGSHTCHVSVTYNMQCALCKAWYPMGNAHSCGGNTY